MEERLVYEILSVVEEIPPGSVATYGQIAQLIGREKKCAAGRPSAESGAEIRGLSLSPGGQL